MTITIVGLGPAGLDRVQAAAMAALIGEESLVLVRTLDHPASAELAALRAVTTCDDLYETADDYSELYSAIADRVLTATGPVVYAVPGSALVGERSVALIRSQAEAAGRSVVMHAGESFLDGLLERVGIDPIADGLQVLDARALPDPMPLHLPTVFTQLDTPATAAELSDELGRVLSHDTEVLVISDVGSAAEELNVTTVGGLARADVGPRTSGYVAPQDVGWLGLVTVNRRLRLECPWDREQTHHSLLKHLVEETYETVDAIRALPATAPAGDPDFGAYAEVEEELGDLLLQVVFHATMAAEAGAFDVEEVAEGIRRKLVSRHPHVFGDLTIDDAAGVEANWERLKATEKRRQSDMDDVPAAMPGLVRADKIQRRAAASGFDWPELDPVIAKLAEEVAELESALGDESRSAEELGDVLFSAVNVARHLGVDAELALRGATARFEARYRWIEEHLGGRDMAAMSLAELDAIWERAKSAEAAPG